MNRRLDAWLERLYPVRRYLREDRLPSVWWGRGLCVGLFVLPLPVLLWDDLLGLPLALAFLLGMWLFVTGAYAGIVGPVCETRKRDLGRKLTRPEKKALERLVSRSLPLVLCLWAGMAVLMLGVGAVADALAAPADRGQVFSDHVSFLLSVGPFVPGVILGRLLGRRLARIMRTDAHPPLCPHCGYPLQGLPEPRCPECGQGFDPALLQPAAMEGQP